MESRGNVYINGEFAGTISRQDDGYVFRYDDAYYANPLKKPISVTLPKTRQEYRSGALFPFFFNMLSEGVNRKLQCRQLKIDEKDDFSLLLATSGDETIGAVSIMKDNNT